MNVRQALVPPSRPEAISVEISDDGSIFAVATDTGFKTYNLETGRLIMSREFDGSIGHVTGISASNVFGLTGGGPSPHYPPNKFVLWQDQTKTERFKIETSLPPIRACMTFEHIALVYKAGILLHELSLDGPKFNSSRSCIGKYETASNPIGLCCLGRRYAVYPARSQGQIQVLNLKSRQNSIVPVHSSRLSAIAMSADEELLATTSSQGTLIRIWSTADSARLFEYRRGLDRAIVFSLSFSPSGRQLAVTSDKSTLHIFDLAPLVQPSRGQDKPAARQTSHTRNMSSSSKPWTVSATTEKRVSIAMTGNSPGKQIRPAISPSEKRVSRELSPRSFDVDRFSVIPGDSVSQVGALPTISGQVHTQRQVAWNDMIRQQPQGRAVSIITEKTEATLRSDSSAGGTSSKGKYGGLANLPFAPKILSDTYSTLSCTFEIGDEIAAARSSAPLPILTGRSSPFTASASSTATSGSQAAMYAAGKPPKGRIGWISEDELVIVGAGLDARWEKFRIGWDRLGKRGIERIGWKRYMNDDGLH